MFTGIHFHVALHLDESHCRSEEQTLSHAVTLIENLRARCAWCGKTVPVTNTGKLYQHRAIDSERCRASRHTPAQADTFNNWREFLKKQWQVGDAIPVSNAVLNTSPPETVRSQVTYVSPVIPEGLDIDAELAFLVDDARAYITRMSRYLFSEKR